MKWYVPSWNGDHRLEATEDGKACTLVVTDPTPAEKETLRRFLKVARANDWTKCKRIPKNPLRIEATVGVAGLVLVGTALPEGSTITAVKFSDGEVEVATGSRSKEVAELAEKAEKEGGKAAVSSKRPTPCCPCCVPGSVERASEVLLEFLTPEQHADWAEHRWIEVVGGLSGHRYVVAHRNSELASGWGKVCMDVDDGGILHFHDWRVPPEEEVLATKLILEHETEHWLRNEATCLFTPGGFTDVYKNPFGGMGDGVADASFTSAIGLLSRAAIDGLRGRP